MYCCMYVAHLVTAAAPCSYWLPLLFVLSSCNAVRLQKQMMVCVQLLKFTHMLTSFSPWCYLIFCHVILPCHLTQSRIQQEQERCLHYLDPSSRRPLLHEVEQQLLAAHMKQILDKGFKPLMSGHRVQDLGRLYSLLGRVNGTDDLREVWKEYIISTGTAIVRDEANVSNGVLWSQALHVCGCSRVCLLSWRPGKCCRSYCCFGP